MALAFSILNSKSCAETVFDIKIKNTLNKFVFIFNGLFTKEETIFKNAISKNFEASKFQLQTFQNNFEFELNLNIHPIDSKKKLFHKTHPTVR